MGEDVYSQKIMRLVVLLCALAIVLAGMTDIGRRAALGGFRLLGEHWQRAMVSVFSRWKPFAGVLEEKMTETDERHYQELLLEHALSLRIREENRQLREMLELEAPPEWNMVRAAVTMRDPAVWNWEFWVGKGARDGIQEGNPVLFGSNLIGRVVEVENSVSRVVTLGSPECQFSVLIRGADGFSYPALFRGGGNIVGSQKVSCSVDYIDKDAKLLPGDFVVTSGLGKNMPAELPVGALKADASGNGVHLVEDSRLAGELLPLANMEHCAFVTILSSPIPKR